MNESVKAFVCETDRLAEMMNLPIKEFLGYANRADELEPMKALQILTRLYMNYCGVSCGMRTVVYYAGDYWIEKLNLRESFCYLMPIISEEYKEYQEEYKDYDVEILTCEETRDIAIEVLEELTDDESKIALCAGALRDISVNLWPSERSIEGRSIAEMDEAIVFLKNSQLIRLRRHKVWGKQNRDAEKHCYTFTDEQAAHLIKLNSRLIELQQQVISQVSRMTMNLQRDIAIHNSAFDSFCLEGSIYIKQAEYVGEDAPKNELLNTLIEATPHYIVLKTNEHTTKEEMEGCLIGNSVCYDNWRFRFKAIEEDYHTLLCNPFLYLMNEEAALAPEDLMKISPEQLQMTITIKT